MTIPFHPFADAFPLIEGAAFDDLVIDVGQNGLIEPIVMHEGKILDGRNRYRACLAADVAPCFEPFAGEDALAYVVSLNLRRRHLDDGQRAAVAARLVTVRRGQNQHRPSGSTSQAEAAALLNVSTRTLGRAAQVLQRGAPALVAAMDAGQIDVATAARVTRLSREDQDRLVACGRTEILQAARIIKAEVQIEKRDKRDAKVVALADATHAASARLGQKLYNVIYADPATRFEVYSRETGLDRAADNHYPTMTLDELQALQIPAARDCVFFLWSTGPMLSITVRLMEDTWGFTYKSNAVWTKDRLGTGYWFRNEHELLLVGTRGSIPAPAMGTQTGSVFDEPVTDHSVKPTAVREMIEQLYPHVPKLEMFARTAAPGWDAWGNEVDAISREQERRHA